MRQSATAFSERHLVWRLSAGLRNTVVPALARFTPQLPFGIAEVGGQLVDVIIAHGVVAVRFDGERVVAYGN